MARNRRKVYEEAVEEEGSTPCRDCGCRHSYAVRTVKTGTDAYTVRRCRNCGREFYTAEPT